jgi:archaeosortase C (PEF-CTERM variant)
MDLPRAVGWAKGHRNSLVVVAFVFVVAGADLLLNRPEGMGIQWFSLPLIAVGIAILVLLFWPTPKPGPRVIGGTLAARFLHQATFGGRLTPFLPFVGTAIVVIDLGYNLWASRTPALLTHDQAMILLGVVMIAYPFIPGPYSRERDFVLLFALGLALILVVPLVLLRLFAGNVSVDAYSAAALAPQTSAILNLLGVQSRIVFIPPESAPGLQFTTAAGLPVTVFITSACSGIYSFAIFSAAFGAYVLAEQRRLTRRVALFFALGIAFAYMANVMRMVVIILIGYRYDTQGTGTQALLFAHSNAGWIIFLAWISLFWALLFRFLPPENPTLAGEPNSPEDLPRRGVFCKICGIVLTPAIPATRCSCGKMYHSECLAGEGRCPACQRPSAPFPVTDQPA